MRQHFTYRQFPNAYGGWSTPDRWIQELFTGLSFNCELEILTNNAIDGRRLGYVEVTESESNPGEVNQSSHGFSVLDVVYDNSGTWELADTSNATHVVIDVSDANNFTPVLKGRHTISSHGLDIYKYWYPSSTSGDLSLTEPSTYNVLLHADTANTVYVMTYDAFDNVNSIIEGLQMFGLHRKTIVKAQEFCTYLRSITPTIVNDTLDFS